MVEMVTQDNLGGYVKGGDPATWFPELWRWVVKEFGVKDVLDLGCGEGHALRYFKDELGCNVVGVDGVEQKDADPTLRIYTHDFERWAWTSWPVDLIWTCEFVEHVEERFLPNLNGAFGMGKLVLMTHAFPKQAGHHHVNCREAEYWKGYMAGLGFRFDQELTNATRSLARINRDEHNHYARSGMAFWSPSVS